jgi:hypothetical protein
MEPHILKRPMAEPPSTEPEPAGEEDRSSKRRCSPPPSSRLTSATAKSTAGSLVERMQKTDFYQLKDRPGQVRMKSNKREYSGTTLGAAEPSYRPAARVAALYPEIGHDPKVKDHSVLVKQNDGSYLLKDVVSGKIAPPESGKPYIFVTMLRNPDDETDESPDGVPREIRIGRNFNGGNAHARLAGHAPYVKFVGEVRFDDACRLAKATRQSGTYLPPKGKERELSGLDCEFTDLPSDHEATGDDAVPVQSDQGAVIK